MKPGETILGFDFGNHLWVVLSAQTPDGLIAVANLTTHGGKSYCGAGCVIIRPGEHSYPKRDSCVYYRGALLNPLQPLLDAREQGALRQLEPFADELLKRVQQGALSSPMTSPRVKQAVESTLEGRG